jgi:hypothetical protein
MGRKAIPYSRYFWLNSAITAHVAVGDRIDRYHTTRLARFFFRVASLSLSTQNAYAFSDYELPNSIRTDTEAIFTAKLFRSVLFILGITPQDHRQIQSVAKRQNRTAVGHAEEIQSQR